MSNQITTNPITLPLINAPLLAARLTRRPAAAGCHTPAAHRLLGRIKCLVENKMASKIAAKMAAEICRQNDRHCKPVILIYK